MARELYEDGQIRREGEAAEDGIEPGSERTEGNGCRIPKPNAQREQCGGGVQQ